MMSLNGTREEQMKTLGFTLVFSILLGAICMAPFATSSCFSLKGKVVANSNPSKYIKVDSLEWLPL